MVIPKCRRPWYVRVDDPLNDTDMAECRVCGDLIVRRPRGDPTTAVSAATRPLQVQLVCRRTSDSDAELPHGAWTQKGVFL